MNTVTYVGLAFALFFVGAIGWAFVFGGRLPSPYMERACQGYLWRREFPGIEMDVIREFLPLFAGSFAFKDGEKLKFRPEDKVLGIYRALYPSRWMPDSLELETLVAELRRRYGIELAKVWSESISLGELFSHAIQRE